jgi:hypothetical protein
VVAEALLAGLTLVCFDHGGPPQVARSLGAEPIERGQASLLADALYRVANKGTKTLVVPEPVREHAQSPALLLEIGRMAGETS